MSRPCLSDPGKENSETNPITSSNQVAQQSFSTICETLANNLETLAKSLEPIAKLQEAILASRVAITTRLSTLSHQRDGLRDVANEMFAYEY